MKVTRNQLRRLILKEVKQINEEFGTREAAGIAEDLHNSMHSSSKVLDFLSLGLASAGTNEEKIGMLFRSMNNDKEKLVRVAKLYRHMYKTPLIKDLVGDLDGPDLVEYVEANFKNALDLLSDI